MITNEYPENKIEEIVIDSFGFKVINLVHNLINSCKTTLYSFSIANNGSLYNY